MAFKWGLVLWSMNLVVSSSNDIDTDQKCKQICHMTEAPSQTFKNGLRKIMEEDRMRHFHYVPLLGDFDELQADCHCNSNRFKRNTDNDQVIGNNSVAQFVAEYLTRKEVSQAFVFVERKKKFESLSIIKQLSRSSISSGVMMGFNFTQKQVVNCSFILLSSASQSSTLQKLRDLDFMTLEHLFLVQSNNPTTLFKDIDVPFNSRVKAFQSDNDTITVKEYYRIAKGLLLSSNHLAVWSSNAGLVLTEKSLWERRASLSGVSFTCATAHDPPYAYVKPEIGGASTPITSVQGLLFELWKELATRSNISSTKFVRSIDGGWGSKLENGSFNGMIGMLNRGEIDCSIASFSLTKERAIAADFLNPLGALRNKLYIKLSGDGNSWDTFVKPFEDLSWLSCILTYFVIAWILTLTYHYGQIVEEDYAYDIKLSSMISVHVMFLQGAPYEPRKCSSRIVFFAAFLAAVVLFASYSACLTSFLAVKRDTFPFSDDESLLTKSDYDIITLKGSLVTDIYNHGDSLKNQIYQTRMVYGESVEGSINKMLSSNVAFYWTDVTVEILTEGYCSIRSVPGFDFNTDLTLFMKKDSPYTGLLNHILEQMRENGQLNKMENRWTLRTTNQCMATEADPLGMNMLLSVFWLLAMSMPVSVMVLVCECLCKRRFASAELQWKK